MLLTCLCKLGPLASHFYIVRLELTGVYIIFLNFAQILDCGYTLKSTQTQEFHLPENMMLLFLHLLNDSLASHIFKFQYCFYGLTSHTD